MKAVPLQWFLLLSITVHALLLWLVNFPPYYEPKPSPPIKVRLLVTPPPPPEKKPLPPRKKPPPRRKKPPPPRKKPPPPPAPTLSPVQPIPHLQPRQPPAPAPRTQPERTGRPDPATSTVPAPEPDRPLTEALVKSWFPSFDDESTDYLDVDDYHLPVPGSPPPGMEIPIPGTDVCIDGDQLRTKRALTITQTETDWSQCEILELGEDEVEYCPPSADTELLIFKGYLVSPLTYREEVCIEWAPIEDCGESDCPGSIDECLKWKTRTRRHPLQYTIRHIRILEVGDDDQDLELSRVIRFVPQCN